MPLLFSIQDLNLSTERLGANKAFTNKLWNAGKFVLQNLPNESDLSAWNTLRAYEVGNFAFLIWLVYFKQCISGTFYHACWTLLIIVVHSWCSYLN